MLRSGTYATCWNVNVDEGNRVYAELSTSRKDKRTDQWETDFSSKYVRCLGDAESAAMKLKRGDRIRIQDFGVTARFDKESGKVNTNFFLFAFEPADSGFDRGGNGGGNYSRSRRAYSGDVNEDDLPV